MSPFRQTYPRRLPETVPSQTVTRFLAQGPAFPSMTQD